MANTILLLGAGGAGKTTIFKQMNILYGEGFKDHNPRIAQTILKNLLSGTRAVLDNCERFGNPLIDEDAVNAAKVVNDAAEVVNDSQEASSAGGLSLQSANALKTLWNNSSFLATYALRAKFPFYDALELFDCVGVFADSLCSGYPEWGGPSWIPSVNDILQMRIRTCGILEQNLSLDGVKFMVFDAGASREDPMRYLRAFDRVSVVIYVVAVSEYDYCPCDLPLENRLNDAVKLFESFCNMKQFEAKPVILFFNKKDIFEDKLTNLKIPLNVTGHPFFETWDPIDWATTSREEALDLAYEWIKEQFQKRCKSTVYSHITCATDTQEIGTVLKACKNDQMMLS